MAVIDPAVEPPCRLVSEKYRVRGYYPDQICARIQDLRLVGERVGLPYSCRSRSFCVACKPMYVPTSMGSSKTIVFNLYSCHLNKPNRTEIAS